MNRGKGMAGSGKNRSRCDAIARLRRSRGFTLIELMIVVAIIAVLASIAYPSYIKYITKTRRNAATACLSEYANYMERHYTTYLSYKQQAADTTWPPALGCADTTQTGDYYNYRFGGTPASPTSTAYSVQAVPQDVQASRDTQCGTLGLNQSGTRFIQSSESTAAPVAACWK